MAARKRFLFSFAALAVAMVVLGTVSLMSLSRLTTSLRQLSSESLQQPLLAALSGNAGDQRGIILSHIVSSTPADKARFDRNFGRLDTELRSTLKAFVKTVSQAQDRTLAAQYLLTHERICELRRKVLPVSRSGDTSAALAIWTQEGIPATKERDRALEALAAFKAGGDDDAAAATSFAGTAMLWTGGAFALTMLLAMALLILSLRGSVRPQLAGGEPAPLSIEQTSALARRSAENFRLARQAIDAVTNDVSLASKNLEALVSSTGGAAEAAGSRSARIGSAIDQITFQTNILALNAAVEAARTDSAAVGVPVVADDVPEAIR